MNALPAEAGGGARHGPLYAAIDLGTNNCRLLIARPGRPGAREPFRVVEAFSRITRLGEGVEASGVLSQAAMDRTLEALKVCGEHLQARGVKSLRAVATEACRRARNGAAFLDRVKRETGIRLEVISTKDEARFAFAGCSTLFDRRYDRALLFDIGGGSTEIVAVGRGRSGRPRLVESVSIPCGVVTFADRFDGRDVTDASYAVMMNAVRDLIEPYRDRLGGVNGTPLQLLGSSGTVTTLCAVHLGLPRYDRRRVDGLWMEAEAVAEAATHVRAMSFDQRRSHPCILEDRADLVVVGAAILEAILDLWPAGRIRVADRGVREGLLISQIQDGRP
ncbi:MAG: Ppx/GppA family phosphatase [Alphaproteobacteria bacterium]|nr:Ppx/GppA family phosphatase [Alphaproteobacteria bacterium]